MIEPTGPARIREALELLTTSPTLTASSAYERCELCGALVPKSGVRQHESFHQALAVVAGQACGPEAQP